VQEFLNKHPEFSLDQEFFNDLPEVMEASKGKSEYGVQLFPQEFDTDGFFLTRLVKHMN